MEVIFYSEPWLKLNGIHGVLFQKTLLLSGFSLNLFNPPWRWRRYVPPNHLLKLNGLHGVILQKIILLTSVRWNYFFHPEDGGDIFLGILSWNSTGYTALYSQRCYFLPDFAELISSTLKMEAISSSESSVETQRFTRRHIPEDGTPCRYSNM
jgi:hypothetical protein